MKYHIWTEGCQMNVADSQGVASSLEKLGYQAETLRPEEADVVILNTCVVRQSAEDKAYGRLFTGIAHVRHERQLLSIRKRRILSKMQDRRPARNGQSIREVQLWR